MGNCGSIKDKDKKDKKDNKDKKTKKDKKDKTDKAPEVENKNIEVIDNGQNSNIISPVQAGQIAVKVEEGQNNIQELSKTAVLTFLTEDNTEIKTVTYPQDTVLSTIILNEMEKIKDTNNGQFNDLIDHPSHYEIIANNIDITEQQESTIASIFPDLQDKGEQIIKFRYAGLDIAKDVKSAYFKTYLIGSPKYEISPFEVIVYDKTQNIVAFQNYVQDDLAFFNQFSSYCNGVNTLFISGGDRQREMEEQTTNSNVLVKMDLVTNEITKLPNLVQGRYWHSMIYVPNNYVFIVGGVNNKTVEVYDTVKNTIAIDSELNEFRSEASLCCVDNTYLYAFCGFKFQDDYIDTVERCDLRAKKREWENVKINFSEKIKSLDICYFAIAYHTPDTLLFLGGTDKKSTDKGNNYSQHNYVYNHKTSKLDYYELPAIDDICFEKFFIPTNFSTSILIPGYNHDIVKVLQYVEGNITVLQFEDRNLETTLDDGKFEVQAQGQGLSQGLKQSQFTFDEPIQKK
jgi:hypothetical protein